MTTEAPYLEDLPCRNKSCKSYGKSHPHCQCYADGGDVQFCSEDRIHKKGCKYFAGGGDSNASPSYEDTQPISSPDEAPPSYEDTQPVTNSHDAPTPSYEDTQSLTPEQGFKNMAESAFPTTDTSRPGADTRSDAQIASDVQAIGEGIGGPLVTGGLALLSKIGVPGTSLEEQEARKKLSPERYENLKTATTIGSLVAGVGVPGAILKGAAALPGMAALAKLGALGRIGASVASNALGMGALSASNATSKALLGEGDPEHPVAMITSEGLQGAKMGAVFGALSSLAPEANIASKNPVSSLLGGLGAGMKGPEEVAAARAALKETGGNLMLFDKGVDVSKVVNTGGLLYVGKEAYQGYQKGGVEEAIIDGLKAAGEVWAGKTTAKYLAPVLIKTMQTISPEEEGSVGPIMAKYAKRISDNESVMDKAIGGVMSAGSAGIKSVLADSEQRSNMRKKIDGWVSKGVNPVIDQVLQQGEGQTPQYAKGGIVAPQEQQPDVSHETLSRVYPDQHMMLTAAKLRTANYLGSLRPSAHSPKLAFDQEPDDTEKKKIYNRALDVAINPLSVLSHIKAGTITKEHVGHMTSMYPELKSVLQQKLTQKISEAQLRKERVPPHVRDGLSLFMGTPLSGEAKPANIQAAQAVFHSQKAAAQNQPANGGAPAKNSKSSLSKMGQSLATSEQARIVREQRQT